MKKLVNLIISFCIMVILIISVVSCSEKKVENAVGEIEYKVEYHDEILFDEKIKVENESVYDVLEKTTLSYDMQNSIMGMYISSLCDHAEKENGPMSGWAYYINDEYASVPCDKYICKNGDIITWKYIYE